jgi:hypothetical protein
VSVVSNRLIKCRGGGMGRRTGLKILGRVTVVSVRVRPSALAKAIICWFSDGYLNFLGVRVESVQSQQIPNRLAAIESS